MRRQPAIQKKEEIAHRCHECAKVKPVTDKFTRCSDSAPLLGRCAEREFAFLLDDCACGLFVKSPR